MIPYIQTENLLEELDSDKDLPENIYRPDLKHLKEESHMGTDEEMVAIDAANTAAKGSDEYVDKHDEGDSFEKLVSKPLYLPDSERKDVDTCASIKKEDSSIISEHSEEIISVMQCDKDNQERGFQEVFPEMYHIPHIIPTKDGICTNKDREGDANAPAGTEEKSSNLQSGKFHVPNEDENIPPQEIPFSDQQLMEGGSTLNINTDVSTATPEHTVAHTPYMQIDQPHQEVGTEENNMGTVLSPDYLATNDCTCTNIEGERAASDTGNAPPQIPDKQCEVDYSGAGLELLPGQGHLSDVKVANLGICTNREREEEAILSAGTNAGLPGLKAEKPFGDDNIEKLSLEEDPIFDSRVVDCAYPINNRNKDSGIATEDTVIPYIQTENLLEELDSDKDLPENIYRPDLKHHKEESHMGTDEEMVAIDAANTAAKGSDEYVDKHDEGDSFEKLVSKPLYLPDSERKDVDTCASIKKEDSSIISEHSEEIISVMQCDKDNQERGFQEVFPEMYHIPHIIPTKDGICTNKDREGDANAPAGTEEKSSNLQSGKFHVPNEDENIPPQEIPFSDQQLMEGGSTLNINTDVSTATPEHTVAHTPYMQIDQPHQEVGTEENNMGTVLSPDYLATNDCTCTNIEGERAASDTGNAPPQIPDKQCEVDYSGAGLELLPGQGHLSDVKVANLGICTNREREEEAILSAGTNAGLPGLKAEKPFGDDNIEKLSLEEDPIFDSRVVDCAYPINNRNKDSGIATEDTVIPYIQTENLLEELDSDKDLPENIYRPDLKHHKEESHMGTDEEMVAIGAANTAAKGSDEYVDKHYEGDSFEKLVSKPLYLPDSERKDVDTCASIKKEDSSIISEHSEEIISVMQCDKDNQERGFQEVFPEMYHIPHIIPTKDGICTNKDREGDANAPAGTEEKSSNLQSGKFHVPNEDENIPPQEIPFSDQQLMEGGSTLNINTDVSTATPEHTVAHTPYMQIDQPHQEVGTEENNMGTVLAPDYLATNDCTCTND